MATTAWVCVLTPNARGAVAVVRIWGTNALAVADAVFRPARGVRLAESARGVPRLGRAGEGLGDEVVAVVVDPVAVGGPLEVELHCHGGPAPVALVVKALVEAGARRCRPESWNRHAAGRVVSAQARADLARAPTVRTAEILLEQAAGALEREVAEVLQESDPITAAKQIERLLARAAVGRRLVKGWSVALAGRPNVGKSRLLNALAGYERAIVDPTPGTTRDVVTIQTAFDGWPVEIADTAGLRQADDDLESAGIALARARQTGADLILLVLDLSEPLTSDDRALIKALPGAVVVANKADLPTAWNVEALAQAEVLAVSAERGDGLDRLAATVSLRLVADPPGPGDGVPFRSEHERRLRAARKALRSGDVAGAAAWLKWFMKKMKAHDR